MGTRFKAQDCYQFRPLSSDTLSLAMPQGVFVSCSTARDSADEHIRTGCWSYSSNTNVTSKFTRYSLIRPSAISTCCSFTHAPLTLRSVLFARSIPTLSASSKPSVDVADISVTRATDILPPQTSSQGYLGLDEVYPRARHSASEGKGHRLLPEVQEQTG